MFVQQSTDSILSFVVCIGWSVFNKVFLHEMLMFQCFGIRGQLCTETAESRNSGSVGFVVGSRICQNCRDHCSRVDVPLGITV